MKSILSNILKEQIQAIELSIKRKQKNLNDVHMQRENLEIKPDDYICLFWEESPQSRRKGFKLWIPPGYTNADHIKEIIKAKDSESFYLPEFSSIDVSGFDRELLTCLKHYNKNKDGASKETLENLKTRTPDFILVQELIDYECEFEWDYQRIYYGPLWSVWS
jgi:hypothetical protein